MGMSGYRWRNRERGANVERHCRARWWCGIVIPKERPRTAFPFKSFAQLFQKLAAGGLRRSLASSCLSHALTCAT